MTPILNTGYVSIHPWTCWERQVMVWHVEIRTNEEVLPAVIYAQRANRIPEELGEFFFWLTTMYGKKKGFIYYSNYNDYVGNVVLSLCFHNMQFNPNVSSNPVGYFIQVVENYFRRSVEKDLKQLKILDRVKEEIDIQCLDHYYELYDCAY